MSIARKEERIMSGKYELKHIEDEDNVVYHTFDQTHIEDVVTYIRYFLRGCSWSDYLIDHYILNPDDSNRFIMTSDELKEEIKLAIEDYKLLEQKEEDDVL